MNSKEILNRLGNNKGNLESYLDLILNSDNNIILFGSSGSGKTTLINKLCGSSFSIQPSQSPQCAESIRKGDFIAIDLPAIDSKEDKLTKYKINSILLSNIPVRMICFVIKYEIHIDLIISEIKIFKEIFEDYTNNTLIIITQCNKPEYIGFMEKEIQKMTDYKRIIFSLDKKDDETLLYDKLVNYMTKMDSIPKMLIKSMNLINLIDTSNYNLFSDEVDYFLKIINLFKEKLEEYENNTEVQRALFFAFKSFKNKFLKKITKSSIKDSDIINFTYIDNLVLELISYLKLIRYEIFCLVEQFKVGLQLGIKSEIDKGIKKCPYCGILWVKYDGSSCIRCGMRGNNNYDMLSKETKNCIVKLIDGKFEITEEIYHNRKQYSNCVEYNNDKMDVYLTKKTK